MVTVKQALREIKRAHSEFQDVNVFIVDGGTHYMATAGYFLFNGAWSDLVEREVEAYDVERCVIACANVSNGVTTQI